MAAMTFCSTDPRSGRKSRHVCKCNIWEPTCGTSWWQVRLFRALFTPRNASLGDWNSVPLPRNVADFLIVVFLGKTKRSFSKGHKIPSYHGIVKCGFYEFLDVFGERCSKHTSFYSQPVCASTALQDAPLKWFCIFWFPNSGENSTEVFVLFQFSFCSFQIWIFTGKLCSQ